MNVQVSTGRDGDIYKTFFGIKIWSIISYNLNVAPWCANAVASVDNLALLLLLLLLRMSRILQMMDFSGIVKHKNYGVDFLIYGDANLANI